MMLFGMRLSNFYCNKELMYSFSTTEDTESTEEFRFAPRYDYPITWDHPHLIVWCTAMPERFGVAQVNQSGRWGWCRKYFICKLHKTRMCI